MNKMERINKKLGFGLMRLPMKDGEVDIEQTCLMVDEFIKAGFNCFDTAHGYLSGKSEKTAKTCLTSRYPRESFILTNKLTDEYFKTNDDIRPFFESQLELCGVDYFDFYLMHAQNKARFRYFKERNAYETAIELKKRERFGISAYLFMTGQRCWMRFFRSIRKLRSFKFNSIIWIMTISACRAANAMKCAENTTSLCL